MQDLKLNECIMQNDKLNKYAELFFKHFFNSVGDDCNRYGLLKTKDRFLQSSEFLFSGYKQDPAKVFGVKIPNNLEEQLILVKNIEFYSVCEHHLLPFFGQISIGYIADEFIYGISDFAKLVEVYSRRLQIQENLIDQISNTIMNVLNPKGLAIFCEAFHLCMAMRGVQKQHSKIVNIAYRGVFKNDKELRNEFINLIKS